MNTPRPVIPVEEAARRVRADHEILLAQVEGLASEELTVGYQVESGPLGDFCESLHDLVAHVLMWDEINLAVLNEAASGRAHWSLDPRWETPDAGLRLNRAGVAAGQLVSSTLLLHRLTAVRDAILGELDRYDGQTWTAPGPGSAAVDGIGPLAQHVWTVPGAPSYWHAAIHLNQIPDLEPLP